MSGPPTGPLPPSTPQFPWLPGQELDAVALNAAFQGLTNQINSLQSQQQLFSASVGRGASVTVNWGGQNIVTDGLYTLTGNAAFIFIVQSMTYSVGDVGGNFFATVQINGVPIQGLTNISVNAGIPLTIVPTGPSTVPVGGQLTILITNVQGPPSEAYITLTSAPPTQAIIGLSPAAGQVLSTSISNGISNVMNGSFGQIFSTSQIVGISKSSTTTTSVGLISSSETVNGIGKSNTFAIGSMSSLSNANGFAGASSGHVSTGTMSSTSASSGIATAGQRTVGIIASTSNNAGISVNPVSSRGTAASTSAMSAVSFGGATESPSGTLITQINQFIYASTTPGTASATFNVFQLKANPGAVNINGTNDATTSNAIEIGYFNRQTYYQNQSGNWFIFVAVGNWMSAVSPLPVPPISESVAGTSITTAGPIIYASSVPGTAAANNNVGSGLNAFSLTANPGQISFNPANGGGIDSVTSNVVQLYYTGHTLWQLNSVGDWYNWQSATITGGVVTGSYGGPTTTPVPTTPIINIATINNQGVNTTFTVTWTYQGYATALTNLIPNSSNQGAIVGSSGSAASAFTSNNLPTNPGTFITNTALDMIYTVQAFGLDTVTKLPFITINWTGTGGTNPDGGDPQQEYNFVQLTNLIPGNTYTLSCSVQAVTGGITTVFLEADMFASGNYISTLPDFNQVTISTTAPTPISGTFVVPDGTTFINAYFAFLYTTGQAVNATFKIEGIQLQNGPAVLPFQSTPFVAIPVMQYQDNGGTWNALPSTVNVTNTGGSFVHPAATSVNSAYVVGVRDANNTAVSAQSNSFQVFAQGLVQLQSFTITNPYFIAGQGAGSYVAAIAVNTAGGSFSGTVTCSNPSFAIATVNGVLNVQNTAVIAAGIYTFNLSATMTNAIGSPLVQSITVYASAANGTTLLSTGTGTLFAVITPGSPGPVTPYTIVGGVIFINGIAVANTSSVTELYNIGYSVFQQNSAGDWFGPVTASSPGTGPLTSPIPAITLSTTNFVATTATSPAESVCVYTLTAGGNIGTPSISLGGSGAANFSFSSTSTVTTTTGTTGTIWTVKNKALPTGTNYPITLTPTI